MALDFRLYLITDRKLFETEEKFLSAVEEALKGGLRAVQLREKDLAVRELLTLAYKMRELTSKYGVKLFINDRADVALCVGADGVHLGESGIPAHAAKKASEGGLLAGVSTHGVVRAEEAEKEGADFITVGPVYETPSKMKYGAPVGIDILKAAASEVKIPVFAIGGVKKAHVPELIENGSYGIALISGILGSTDIKNTTEEFMRLLK